MVEVDDDHNQCYHKGGVKNERDGSKNPHTDKNHKITVEVTTLNNYSNEDAFPPVPCWLILLQCTRNGVLYRGENISVK